MTKTDITNTLKRLQRVHGIAAVKKVLKKFGAAKVSEVKKKDYPAIVAETKSFGRAHAKLSPSSAGRWSVCHAYPQAASLYPESTSSFAIEGTVAHAMAEVCLVQQIDPINVTVAILKEKVPEWEDNAIPDDMCDAVQTYLDIVRQTIAEASDDSDFYVEMKVDLSHISPGMFGTLDFALFDRGNKKITVYDYKHGAGVWVDVDDNKQLILYSNGGLLSVSLVESTFYKNIETGIVQPRCFKKGEKAFRTKTYTVDQLLRHGKELEQAAAKTILPDPKFVPGKHCQFCPYAGDCKALRDVALNAILYDEEGNIRSVDELTPEQIAVAHEMSEGHVVPWTKAIWSKINYALERGSKVPGWKRVQKVGNRAWIDVGKVEKALTKAGVKGFFSKPKLLSPAQVEKLHDKEVDKETLINIVKQLAIKPDKGYAIVKDSDSRQEIEGTNPTTAFKDLSNELDAKPKE